MVAFNSKWKNVVNELCLIFHVLQTQCLLDLWLIWLSAHKNRLSPENNACVLYRHEDNKLECPGFMDRRTVYLWSEIYVETKRLWSCSRVLFVYMKLIQFAQIRKFLGVERLSKISTQVRFLEPLETASNIPMGSRSSIEHSMYWITTVNKISLFAL